MFEGLILLVLAPLIISIFFRQILERSMSKKKIMKILPNFASLAAIMAMLLMFTSVSMNIAKGLE